MQFEDAIAPCLGLTVKGRAVYCHLLRHSLVVGKPRIKFAVTALGRTLYVSIGAARQAVRRLDELGALRVLKRNKNGHFVEMRLPEKIRAVRPSRNGASMSLGVRAVGDVSASTLETKDFWKTWELRKAIHARERGACFYCLRRARGKLQCLDDVVPRVRFGRNSCRNLVSCCVDCNTRKADRCTPSRVEGPRRRQAPPLIYRKMENRNWKKEKRRTHPFINQPRKGRAPKGVFRN